MHLLFGICCGNSAQCEQGSEFFCAWGVYPHGMPLESFPCVHIFICMTLLVSIVLGTDLVVPHDKFHISEANDFLHTCTTKSRSNPFFESIFLFLSFCKIFCIAKKWKCFSFRHMDLESSKHVSFKYKNLMLFALGFAYLLSYIILEYENLN